MFSEPALNTFSAAQAQKIIQNSNYAIMQEVAIATYPLAAVLERYVPGSKKIDFFNIDVEGLDLAVLQSNNWQKFAPDFILIEGNCDFNHLEDNAIYRYLQSLNYRLVARTLRTFIFQRINA
jgi:hypothetical protein